MLAACLGLSSPANAQATAGPDGIREAPITVTVVPFASADVGQDAWLGKAIADLLSRKLAEAPSYVVLNRDMLQTFLDEMELQASGFFTQAEADRLGRIAKVEQVVYGNFRRQNNSLAINLLLVDLVTQQGIKRAQVSGSLEAMHELVAGLALQLLSLEGVVPSPELDAKIRFAPTTSLSAIEYFYTAFDHLDQGRHEEAFGAFYAATQRDPDFREAELWMGRTLESSGFADLAVVAYDKLAKRSGRHVEILDVRFFKARLLENTNHEEAVATYQQLADLRPETPHTLEAAVRLAALLEKDGDVAGAYDYLLMIDNFRAHVEEGTGAPQRSNVPAGTLATLLNEVWVYFQSDAAARSRQSSLPNYITESGLRRSRFLDWPHALGLYREAILKTALLLPPLPEDQDPSRSLPRGVFLVDPANPTIVERNHAIRPSLFHEETVGTSWREKFFAIAIPPGYVATGVEMEVAGRVRKRSPFISYSMRLLPFPWPANYHNAWLGTVYGQTTDITRLRKSVIFHGQTRPALALQFTENSSAIREWRLKVRLRREAELAPSVSTPPIDFKEDFREGHMVSRMPGTTGAVDPAMSIEAAYRAIPHNRTAFVPAQAQMSREESIYLEALFALTDCAVAERVYLQDRLRRGQAVDIRAPNYRAILEGLSSLGTPAELLSVEGLINEAIEEQRDYLEQWAQSGNPKYFNRHAPLVQESHGKLIAAYLELIRRYGVESARNRQAFYDYLCALDFI